MLYAHLGRAMFNKKMSIIRLVNKFASLTFSWQGLGSGEAIQGCVLAPGGLKTTVNALKSGLMSGYKQKFRVLCVLNS